MRQIYDFKQVIYSVALVKNVEPDLACFQECEQSELGLQMTDNIWSEIDIRNDTGRDW